jgi:hypothetical protein
MKEKQAEEAWNKVIARNRQKVYKRNEDGKRIGIYKNRVSAYTTPEGFRFCYKRWVKNKKPGYEMITAPTRSNPHLPEDYIEALMSTYPPQLVEAYLEGKFVNLTSGAVYCNFDRHLNHTNRVVRPKDELHIGMDFNVMVGASVVHVIDDDIPKAVDEIHNAYDTDEQIEIIKERYGDRHRINVYPDASGKNRTAANTTETDIQKLHNAGFVVHQNFKNPPIKDRVASYNAMICNGKQERRYLVNTDKCPNLTDGLEQQVYGDNGLPDKKAGVDHIVDAPGYFMVYEYPIVKPEPTISSVRGHY